MRPQLAGSTPLTSPGMCAGAGNLGPHNGQDHMRLVAEYVKTKFPFWNRTEGRDHIFWMTLDRCADAALGP